MLHDTIIKDKLHMQGEHSFIFISSKLKLEAILTTSAAPSSNAIKYMAILGHPHSLKGGTMNNKVVTTIAKAFKELDIPSIRFNFRGVGNSEGIFDRGIGESEDMLALIKLCKKEFSDLRFIFAGFSFGSYVAYRAALAYPNELLITVAPPVENFNYQEASVSPFPWVIFQGEEDELTPLATVENIALRNNPPIPIIYFANTGHFFHHNLIALKNEMQEQIRKYVLNNDLS